MSVCHYCNQEMLTVDTCTITHCMDLREGIPLERIRYQNDDPGILCHDCNVVPGALHHPGCDAESCARCKGQAISCECLLEDLPPAGGFYANF